MDNNVIYLRTFEEALAAVEQPVTERIYQSLMELLEACGQWASESYKTQKFREYKDAEALEGQIHQQMTVHECRLTAAEADIAAKPEGSWVMGTISVLAFVACFGAEFVLNWAILPWILGVPPRSILGLALGLAPATAPVLLDRIIAKVFGVDDSVDAISSVAPPMSRRARAIVKKLFLVVVAALTLYSIWMLADSRSIASEIMHSETAIGVDPTQQRKINLSLLMISVVVTINGALFYLFGAHEIKHAFDVRKARAARAELLDQMRSVKAAHTNAVAVLASAQHEWEHADSLAQSVSDRFRADGKVKLDQLMAKPAPAQPASSRVVEILNRRFDPRASMSA